MRVCRWALVPRVEDVARVGNSFVAAEELGILGDQLQDLFQQIGIGHDLALAEIDQPLVDAVALRPPAVLVDQHGGVAPPALVAAAQAPEHAQEAAIDRRHRDAVSSRRVQMSVSRSSSVGKRTLGRTSHQSLLPSSITPALISAFRCRSNSPKLSNCSGRPVRGSSSNTARR